MNEHAYLSERETYIISLLESHSRISTQELCRILKIAPSSMRKQLAEMEKRGLLIRVHGGAVSIDSRKDESIHQKSCQNILPKRAIAKQARTLIHDGDVIALGSGTTVGELCYHLMDLKDALIFTNSLIVANILSKNEHVEIRICSGIIRGRTGSIVGPGSSTFFQKVHADKAFIGPDAVNVERGILSSNISVAQVEMQMLQSSSQKYVLCDASKIGRDSISQIIPITGIDCLITDPGANKVTVHEIAEKGVQVMMSDWNREV